MGARLIQAKNSAFNHKTLAKTFQDAIQVARYLRDQAPWRPHPWMDALCIIQDSCCDQD